MIFFALMVSSSGSPGPAPIKYTLAAILFPQYQEREIKKIEECFPFKDKPAVTWININGIHDAEIMGKIGEYVGLHPLLLEDIMNTDQRPKIEDFGDYIFIILKISFYKQSLWMIV